MGLSFLIGRWLFVIRRRRHSLAKSYAQSKQLRYARMAICETLRLFPVLPRLLRQASSAAKVAGYDVPKGARVRISLIART